MTLLAVFPYFLYKSEEETYTTHLYYCILTVCKYAALRIRINACSSSLKKRGGLWRLNSIDNILSSYYSLQSFVIIIPGHCTMHGLADPQLLRPPTERSCAPTHHSGEHNTSKMLSWFKCMHSTTKAAHLEAIRSGNNKNCEHQAS